MEKIKKPKRTKPEHSKCIVCKKAVHIDDFCGVNKQGIFHKQCAFKIFHLDMNSFIKGVELKIPKSSDKTGNSEEKE